MDILEPEHVEFVVISILVIILKLNKLASKHKFIVAVEDSSQGNHRY